MLSVIVLVGLVKLLHLRVDYAAEKIEMSLKLSHVDPEKAHKLKRKSQNSSSKRKQAHSESDSDECFSELMNTDEEEEEDGMMLAR